MATRTHGLIGAAQRVLRRTRTADAADEADPCVRALRDAIGADKVRIDGAGRYPGLA